MTLPLGIPGPRVVGIDLALVSTGLGLIKDGAGFARRLQPGARKGHVRMQWIGEQVVEHCTGADLVLIEAIAFGAKGQTMFQIAGNWYHTTHELWKAGIPYVPVPSTCLKKYATGKGNAGKDEVLLAVVKRYPNVAITGNDMADAFTLAAMGADWLGAPVAKVPELNRSVLATIRSWPTVRPWPKAA